MTHLELYDNALIEQNKLEAPPLLIEEYNYLINKAIIQYINLTYARFDLNQQSSDDLRWLQKSDKLEIKKQLINIVPGESAKYICELPSDYFHILNCVVEFTPNSENPDKDKCGNPLSEYPNTFSMCRRLTANQYPAIIQNAYLKPSYKRPYFFLKRESYEIDSYGNNRDGLESGEDPNTIKPMEIRCGDTSLYTPKYVYIDYLKLPDKINLTWEDVNGISDTTNVCEFPNAVAYEIINIFTKLLLENASDPRMQTHYAINQTVGGVPTSNGKE